MQVLARHPDEVPTAFAKDKNLLAEYADWLFTEYKQRFAQNKNISNLQLMEIFLDGQSDYAKLRAWGIYGLVGRSNVLGRAYLDSLSGRFVGLAPEAPQSKINEADPQKISDSEEMVPEKVEAYTSDQLRSALNEEGIAGTLEQRILGRLYELRSQ